MNKQDAQVMTVEEVATYLKIPKSSIYKIAQERKIPCQKVGRQWRFHRHAIDEWLGKRSFNMPLRIDEGSIEER